MVRPRGPYRSLARWIRGISSWHGAHQVAQKFRTTGLPRSWLRRNGASSRVRVVKSGAGAPTWANPPATVTLIAPGWRSSASASSTISSPATTSKPNTLRRNDQGSPAYGAARVVVLIGPESRFPPPGRTAEPGTPGRNETGGRPRRAPRPTGPGVLAPTGGRPAAGHQLHRRGRARWQGACSHRAAPARTRRSRAGSHLHRRPRATWVLRRLDTDAPGGATTTRSAEASRIGRPRREPGRAG